MVGRGVFIELHTVLVVAHLLALAVGLGAALLADCVAAQLLVQGATARRIAQLKDLSQAVSVGLAALWSSGASLVWFNAVRAPATLGNEKLWAKLLIVALLTVNAVVLHRYVLPLVETRIGRPLFEPGQHRARALCALSAAVSLVSWVAALYLGAAREWNGVVTVRDVLAHYAACVLLLWLACSVACLWIGAHPARTAGAAPAN